MGVDSHGIVRIHNYVNSITSGAILPGAKPEVVRDNGVAVLMDGREGFRADRGQQSDKNWPSRNLANMLLAR